MNGKLEDVTNEIEFIGIKKYQNMSMNSNYDVIQLFVMTNILVSFNESHVEHENRKWILTSYVYTHIVS